MHQRFWPGHDRASQLRQLKGGLEDNPESSFDARNVLREAWRATELAGPLEQPESRPNSLDYG